jgi:hypothetical protein
VYAKIDTGSPNWAQLKAPEGKLYPWDPSSTYIKKPPFFENMTKVGRTYATHMYSIYYHHYVISGPGSSVGIATGYGLDGPVIESRWG